VDDDLRVLGGREQRPILDGENPRRRAIAGERHIHAEFVVIAEEEAAEAKKVGLVDELGGFDRALALLHFVFQI